MVTQIGQNVLHVPVTAMVATMAHVTHHANVNLAT